MDKRIIKEGFLIDPGNNRIGIYDLLIEGENIIKVEEEINLNHGAEVINAKGKYIVPGFIDLQVNPGNTIEYIADILPFCGITTPLVMPCNTFSGIPIIEHYGGLKDMLDVCEGQSVNIATAVSIEPYDTRGHETYAKLAVPYERLSGRIEEFIEYGITAIGEVVLPLGGIAHIESDISQEFLDKLLDKSILYDIPLLLHTGAGLNGVQRAVETAGGRRLHICHVGSTVSKDSIYEAIKILENNPNITTDTHLSEIAGSTSKSSGLVLEYFKRGEVVKIDPATLQVAVQKDLNTSVPPFYYNKEKVFENNIICALSDRVDAIESDELGDGIRAKFMLKNLFKIVNIVSLEHVKIKLLTKFVEKLTVNPAKILNINRGTLAEGDFADILLLDLENEKIDTILVNGEKVIWQGKLTGMKPGKRIKYKA